MEFNQEEAPKESEFKQWFQDNLRIIVSILVVVIIAAGIYSFSNRSVEVDQAENESEQSDILDNIIDGASDESSIQAENDSQTQNNNSGISVPAGKETGESFIETAAKGDGTTRLARRALADYLEKNPDASITKEHKIYIEDYLRKNVSAPGGVKIGTTVEFSKTLIQDAISKSKNLNENQLTNLHKYVLLVPSLQ